MIRLIKRYGGASRKLYDTEESRYVSLEELADWIRAGQDLKVVDNVSGEDVTAQTLAQSIYEDHRHGHSLLSVDFLHEVIRRGGKALTDGVGEVQTKVGALVGQSLDRVTYLGGLKEDLARLQDRLAGLEAALAELETRARRRNGAGHPRGNHAGAH